MKILIATLVTLLLAQLSPVHINNSTTEQHHDIVVATEPSIDPVEVANQTPMETVTTVVEPVQEPRKGCELAYNYDWPQDIAYAICMAESSGNQDAVNWSDNHGKCVGSFSLWQVGCFWYPFYGYSSEDFYNPVVNVKIAYQIYKRQGNFNAWTTYTRGSYLKYL